MEMGIRDYLMIAVNALFAFELVREWRRPRTVEPGVDSARLLDRVSILRRSFRWFRVILAIGLCFLAGVIALSETAPSFHNMAFITWFLLMYAYNKISLDRLEALVSSLPESSRNEGGDQDWVRR